jgi:hypothetical protein
MELHIRTTVAVPAEVEKQLADYFSPVALIEIEDSERPGCDQPGL